MEMKPKPRSTRNRWFYFARLMELESTSLVFVYPPSLIQYSTEATPKKKKKKTVSALKCIGWNETQENCASFSLWSDAFLNAWSHCLKAIPIWTMANAVSKGCAGFDCYVLTSSHSSKKTRAEDQRIEVLKRIRVSRYVHRYMRL